MRKILLLIAVGAVMASAQFTGRTPRKKPGQSRPECSPGAICFTGEVSAGQEFRKTLNAELEFVLLPGWTIAVAPKHAEDDCQEFASVVNAPYRTHRDLYINVTYGWSADQEVSTSPREFRFVTNCADYRTEFERLNAVLWPYTVSQSKYEEALAKLGTSPLGKGRLWITDSRVSHADDTPDDKLGKIEWMRFSVEIVLPPAARN